MLGGIIGFIIDAKKRGRTLIEKVFTVTTGKHFTKKRSILKLSTGIIIGISSGILTSAALKNPLLGTLGGISIGISVMM